MKRQILATVATACICAGSAFAAGNGIKAQIASERKGNTKAFEEALATTESRIWISPNGGQLPYRLHVPETPEPGKSYPLVVHMHGAGSWGTNNVDQIRSGGADFISWAKRHGEEYVFIAPQTPKRCKWVDTPWENQKSTMKETPTPSLRMAMEIIDDAVARYPIDRNRIYVMGISMGGYAAWELLQRRPELFAAGLPCCGGGDVAQAPRLKNVAIWAFHGSVDKGVPVCRSRDMVAAIKAAGGKKILYREYKGLGHNVWTPTFSDDKVFKWLFSQRRGGKKKMKRIVVGLLAVAMAGSSFASLPALIPIPRELKLTGGTVAFAATNSPKVEVVASIPPEGYELSITKDGVTIRHSDDAGLFYAKQTLAQLRADATERVPPGKGPAPSGPIALPCLEIKDSPAFHWRGVHLGETQRLYGKGTIKRMLDLMARYKFNVFHWHFTDVKGWRIDFPEYPNLARKSALPGLCSNEQALFYSKEDVADILAYAKERHITVVPELDFPGHSRGITTAYPDFACPVKAKKRPDVLCVGNPETLKFAERAIDWVCETFPSEVIHIGGDECPRHFWEKCPRCREFMKQHGMKSTKEIQPWFTRHLAEYIAKKGRKAIGWDDIVTEHGNVAKALDASVLPDRESVMVMGYRCRSVILASLAANMGYKVVQSPSKYTYFDYRQGIADDPFKYFGRSVTPLETAYKFDPYEDVKPEARANVIGGQCCNWTLYTLTYRDLEWKMWPRAFATAEILWTNPEPKKRDFAEFSVRAAEHRRRLIREHVNCAPLK